MPKVRMQSSNPDCSSVTVEGTIQYDVKNSLVDVEEPHVKNLIPMGFTVVTSDDDIVLTREQWDAKRASAEYAKYLDLMRARLGAKFVDPNVVAAPEAQKNGKPQAQTRA